jgi:hypothetical protein
MLIIIAKVIGGSVIITGKGRDVIWVVNKKETIQGIIQIFDLYPLITSKKICQLYFLKDCMSEDSVNWYLLNRNNKYNDQQSIIHSYNEKSYNTFSYYFEAWFSGLIEVQGSFSIGKHNNPYFFIECKNDVYLINIIKEYLGSTNIIRNPSPDFYSLEIYNKKTLKTIINHFNNYPLLGEKAEYLRNWKLNK